MVDRSDRNIQLNSFTSQRERMTFEQSISLVERLCEEETNRREQFRDEFEAYEANQVESFPQTRESIGEERILLLELDKSLERERQNIEALVENADFLTVEQAIKHREKSIEKLAVHNEALQGFHDALTAALDIIEENLVCLERDGPSAVAGDPQRYLDACQDAVRTHNEAIEGITKNLTILNAYLL